MSALIKLLLADKELIKALSKYGAPSLLLVYTIYLLGQVVTGKLDDQSEKMDKVIEVGTEQTVILREISRDIKQQNFFYTAPPVYSQSALKNSGI